MPAGTAPSNFPTICTALPPGAAALWKDPRAVAGLIPLARAGTPEEAAGGVLLLASPFATYITGHTLEVTGGMGI